MVTKTLDSIKAFRLLPDVTNEIRKAIKLDVDKVANLIEHELVEADESKTSEESDSEW